jgi:hypothetical protein
MRRSFLHTALAALLAITLAGCSRDIDPTSPTPGARSSGLIPIGPIEGRPPRVDPNAFADIVAGENHTCARKNNNTVYCWGWTWHGQAGTQMTGTCSGVQCVDRPQILGVWTPEFNRGTLTATKIDAGSNHTCIIDTRRRSSPARTSTAGATISSRSSVDRRCCPTACTPRRNGRSIPFPEQT